MRLGVLATWRLCDLATLRSTFAAIGGSVDMHRKIATRDGVGQLPSRRPLLYEEICAGILQSTVKKFKMQGSVYLYQMHIISLKRKIVWDSTSTLSPPNQFAYQVEELQIGELKILEKIFGLLIFFRF